MVERPVGGALHAEHLAKAAPVDALHAIMVEALDLFDQSGDRTLRREAEDGIPAPVVDVEGEAVRNGVAVPLLHVFLAVPAHLDHHVRREHLERLRRVRRGAVAHDMDDLAGAILQELLGDVRVEEPELLAPVVARAVQVVAVLAATQIRRAVVLTELADLCAGIVAAQQLLVEETAEAWVGDAARLMTGVRPDRLTLLVPREILGVRLAVLFAWAGGRIGVPAVGKGDAAPVDVVRHVVGEVVAAPALEVRLHRAAAEVAFRHGQPVKLRDLAPDPPGHEEEHADALPHELDRRQGARKHAAAL